MKNEREKEKIERVLESLPFKKVSSDVGTDEIWKEYEKRKKRKLWIKAALIPLGAGITAVLVIWFHSRIIAPTPPSDLSFYARMDLYQNYEVIKNLDVLLAMEEEK